MGADGNKEPGPNRFSLKIARKFWPEFKDEVIALFHQFFVSSEFNHRFPSSFISLIPKVRNPSSFNDFRSISLLGWLHKLVTQILAVRLKRVIGKFVRDMQSAFIKGRNIFQRWTVATEVLDAMKRNREDFVFKIDFKKAYNCVDWDFYGLFWVKWGLERNGFSG